MSGPVELAQAELDYAGLDPQQVLDALDAVGLRGDGRVLQLNSYENRVFQVFLEEPGAGPAAVVAKFYRPGRWNDAQILEEHAFALELAAAEVPVVPPLVLGSAAAGVRLLGTLPTLATGFGHRWAVAARCAGREPELEDPAALRQLGRFIGRLHAVGRRRPFEHRHHLDPRVDGQRAMALLLDGGFVPATEAPAWRQAGERALALVMAAFDSHFPADAPLATLRLHGDCHLGNVLWRDGAPHMVDLDDAMQGPAVQDLWMLVSGDHATMAQQLDVLLEGYGQFSPFDYRERALIEPLRTLRMLRHSAWLAARWADPTFPLNFPFFGSAAYWNQQTTQLREQVEAMAAYSAVAGALATRPRWADDGEDVDFDGDGFA
ncbi:MAG: serine/threonine protein kinase [Leptothrix sp. (in: Bacteria)]|nr:serine/threonine protein kinase [Leptothrix sp. (in: b-proteobacteria)]